MVMDAVGKPNPFQISFQSNKLRIRTISFIADINSLQRTADRQIITTVLVEQNIPAHQGSFRQMI